ncbi:MAG: DUF3078 domain-containing protein [Bacteroidales bacterium]|nr:DUF3078 domain-containing protein [Bacteroidales bacterium]MBN2698456.1 DUF3078 domain-containing protein [Bacteroidales bacterium]
MRRIIFFILGVAFTGLAYAQSHSESLIQQKDTTHYNPIIVNVSSATSYIQRLLDSENLWRPDNDTMKRALVRLLDHTGEPYDSVETKLRRFNFAEIAIEPRQIIHYDSLQVRWLNDSTFILDTAFLEKDPFIVKKTFPAETLDISEIFFKNELPDIKTRIDSLLKTRDTIYESIIDTAFLSSRNIEIFRITNEGILPPIIPEGSHQSVRMMPDSSNLLWSDTLGILLADAGSPFYIVPDTLMPDSLQTAVQTLLAFTEHRDSTFLILSDIYRRPTPFWISSGKNELYRFWVKNYKNDSITIWIGNPEKNELSFILEEDVDVNRLSKESIDDIPIADIQPDLNLASMEQLNEIPVYWDYELSSTFALNQTYLSNWSSGGENSLSSMLDIIGTSKYTNKENKTEWTSSGRLKFGTIITEEHGLRTNTDMFELNSQWNRIIRKKIDLSATFYMKSQIARGYNYPNDSVVISKFLNPGTMTIGLGMEFKPFKNTSFNFSPLSYKNTFVLDTANIEQTKHGIAGDKRSRQEMGAQLLFRNKLTLLEDLNINNSLRLFSSYLNKPQNIDVDWEIYLDKKISWYFSVRLNLHLIYDDDIRFTVLDEDNQPVYLPDGTIRKAPKMQFKEFLGLTLLFKF